MAVPKPGGPPKPYVSRVVKGDCLWDIGPDQYAAAFAAMLKRDAYAHGDMESMMEAAEKRGGLAREYFEDRDYRAPLIYAPPAALDPPWLGELKVRGRKGAWRLYFGEPVNRQGLVVPLDVGFKSDSDSRATQTQQQHIERVMALLKSHFSELGYTWRGFYD